ncbi:fluoride efflux transporter CrcB [Methanomassiliicoccus luminyensis]|jgi:CrcB protein|uniref:fluoride efflux transporter CrcB n=1 Tax=Methanomassiliicoccus luminyensis TaxID=1080712 RepID=UPI00037E729C|nr:fluoride efflux transporter CrcB [Methanomassiliicoccus luminyensis]
MEPVDIKLILLVATGGAIGSVLRYLVQGYLTRGDFPWGTFAVNIIGSFLISLIFFYLSQGTGLTPEFRAFMFIGIFGGFTTMSSFSLDTVALFIEGQWLWALGNIILNGGLCVIGAFLGRAVGLLLGGY